VIDNAFGISIIVNNKIMNTFSTRVINFRDNCVNKNVYNFTVGNKKEKRGTIGIHKQGFMMIIIDKNTQNHVQRMHNSND